MPDDEELVCARCARVFALNDSRTRICEDCDFCQDCCECDPETGERE